VTVSNPSAPASSGTELHAHDLLVYMPKQQASDLHLKPMRPPLCAFRGKLVPVKSDPLKPADLEKMLLPLLSRGQKEKFEALQSVDFGYGVPGVARFRANVYMQRGTVGAVFRRIPSTCRRSKRSIFPTPSAISPRFPDGLVLVHRPDRLRQIDGRWRQ